MTFDTSSLIRTRSDEIAVENGCVFDLARAERVCEFFSKFIKHTNSQWAGKPFELLDWQKYQLIYPMFGWVRPDGRRRFRKAYIEVPKKNGKTTLCAGICLYMLIADNEVGAQVYSAAADRHQAAIVFREARAMVDATPMFKERLWVTESTKNITDESTNSFYMALSADVPTKEGLNISALVFDELHAQKKRELWDALAYGGASRRQPLLVSITTAGWDRHTICWEQHDYAQKVIDGIIEDDTFLPFIAAASPQDDWTIESTWKKANPSYGVTIDPAEMKAACAEAMASPAKENSFKRYRLNLWTEQAERWLTMTAWDACAGQPVVEDDFIGQRCYGALDLSSTRDLTCLVLLFPDYERDMVHLLPYFWLPGESAIRREHDDRVPYTMWARQGYINLCNAPTIDHRIIKEKIIELKDRFEIIDIAYDPWNAEQMAKQLSDEHDVAMVKFPQNYLNLSAPTKAFEGMVLSKRIHHGGHPVLKWNAGNVAIDIDANDNWKINKEKSADRIDGIAASIMALGRHLSNPENAGISIYETRTPTVIDW